MLAVARELLVEVGPEGLRPTEVARRAEVPIGSVYQYFADRHDLLAVLVQRYFAVVREMMERQLADQSSLDAVLMGLRAVAWEWWRLHAEEPSFRPLLHAIMGDPALQTANIDDSRASTQLFVEALRPHLPVTEAFERTLLMVNHLFVPALQLALAQPTEAECQALFGSWIAIAETAIRALVAVDQD